jgi:hypothetical protein
MIEIAPFPDPAIRILTAEKDSEGEALWVQAKRE